MPTFSNRSSAIEIMDDLDCEGEVVEQTLRELDIINRKLGGNKVSINALNLLIKEHPQDAIKIADLGCGGGDIMRAFHRWGMKHQKHLNLVGLDANPFIVEYARKNLKGLRNVSFKTENVLSRTFASQQFDVIHCSLFLHHFTDDELVHLFQVFDKQSRIGVIINDLHRHWLAYSSIKLLTRLFSKSSMVKYDAPLSVKRGFRRPEIEDILKRAGLTNYRLSWKWAFRWQLILSKHQ